MSTNPIFIYGLEESTQQLLLELSRKSGREIIYVNPLSLSQLEELVSNLATGHFMRNDLLEDLSKLIFSSKYIQNRLRILHKDQSIQGSIIYVSEPQCVESLHKICYKIPRTQVVVSGPTITPELRPADIWIERGLRRRELKEIFLEARIHNFYFKRRHGIKFNPFYIAYRNITVEHQYLVISSRTFSHYN